MGLYCRGDVLIASVALDERSVPKARPVVVIGTDESGRLRICPVSSKPPSDAPCLPLSIDEFATGGLDLFGESYIMTSRVLVIRSGDVMGKRGRLTAGSLAEILARAPRSRDAGSEKPQKPRGRQNR